MKLHYQEQGAGQPIFILHGLFGSLENWGMYAKKMSSQHRVVTLDLRNHGQSPHADAMNYPVMAEDVFALMDRLNLESAAVLGHSMGGKVAMQMALQNPERVSRLMVVDIAPVTYAHQHDDVIEGLQALPLDQCHSRSQADAFLQDYIAQADVRAFLLKNLERDEHKRFRLRINLDAIARHYADIAAAPRVDAVYHGRTCFVKGALSAYIQEQHIPDIQRLFPQVEYVTIAGAGHWPHAEKPAAFFQQVEAFFGL